MKAEELCEYVGQIFTYLKSDLSAYEKARDSGVRIGAGPYLLTASSGIDFFGSLAVPNEELSDYARKCRGLKGKSAPGSKWYIRTYLGVVDPTYSVIKVDDMIYKTLRCGQVHEGIVKEGVLIGTEMSDELHLKILKLKESDAEGPPLKVVYINTRILASNFIDSIEHFVKDMKSDGSFVNEMATRLSDHLSATEYVCQNIGLPEQEVDPDIFDEIYDISSCSPQEMEGSYTLRNRFWEEA